MRWILIIGLIGTAEAWASPTEPRGTAAFLCPREINPSAVWTDADGRLRVHLALLHLDRQGEPMHDGRTYTIDPRLFERLEEDLGEFAPLALRRIEQALHLLPCPLKSAALHRALSRSLQHIWRHLPYQVRPHVVLIPNTELWVYRVARSFFRRKGRRLVITSGTRRPLKQAAAMYRKLASGARYRRLYRKRELAEEIRQAFIKNRRRGKRRRQIIQAMAEVIEAQMSRGHYVSAHLKQVAVDVRSRGMTRSMKRVFRRVAESFEGMRLIREERRPPHFHLEVPAAPATLSDRCPVPEVPEEAESQEPGRARAGGARSSP